MNFQLQNIELQHFYVRAALVGDLRMKKLLIATAALAMVAGTAQAQSSVTVYGAVGASTNSYKTNGADVAARSQNGSRDQLGTTALGFRGTEDLGGGLTAFFTLEGDLSMSGVLGGNPAVPTISGTQGSEVNTARLIKMSLEAMAIGTVHQKLDQMELGRLARFEGFLTHKSLRSQRLVFHITHIEL